MKIQQGFCVLLLFFFPGCTPYQSWVKNIFYQGEKVDQPTALVRQYLRTEHVYDQFATLGHFSAIWLSNEVRRVFAHVYACKFCYDHDRFISFLQSELEKNKKYSAFYVLTATPSCYNSILSDQDPEWSTCLYVDNKMYRTLEIKEVDLPAEYALFFGKTNTRFKTAFLVTFAAQNDAGPIIKPGVEQIDLVFSRADRKVYLTWCLDSNANVVRTNVDKDPDVLFYDLECCP